jgi:hypothetical protein
MKTIILFAVSCFSFFLAHSQKKQGSLWVIAHGQTPNIAKDKNNTIHIVYGSGDSIIYISSRDGKYFTPPSLVAVLPKLFAFAMRGPQIAATINGPIVSACTKEGNIFSYKKETSGKWTKAVRVNNTDETAKEALMALSADGLNAYAVWLGVSGQKGQKLYGAKSADGGKTWAKNKLVYASPDSTVCECCKPSVAMNGNKVYVMFRNWLNGARDMYLITSANGGKSFGKPQKLGIGSWKLKGCPMDGGGIAINKSGNAETVWRREGNVYASIPGIPEKKNWRRAKLFN